MDKITDIAKQELSSYTQDLKYIQEKRKDVEELRVKAEKVTTELSDMPKRR